MRNEIIKYFINLIINLYLTCFETRSNSNFFLFQNMSRKNMFDFFNSLFNVLQMGRQKVLKKEKINHLNLSEHGMQYLIF